MNGIPIDFIFLIYLGIMSIIGFFTMRADKERAKKNQYRIAENTLWGITILGGAAGTYFGMKTFRHKTKRPAFKFGLPFFFLVYLILIVFLLIK
ncbi:DUF1294 domain-containing protein [Jeotgalibacillus sp. S-D1]|uniref:DUF1294 domain-containing protein n=1 Tax=Jeotgalibacillus sp. S-D1 TaxID=2552189 RepID=UPI001F0DB599|nr:DUF1294 domain-containing protein [Jeotgalibacillus sp. S-D1]